jgi:hypothetical protein
MKTKIKKAVSLQRILALVGLALLVVLGLSNPLGAQTFTQGYGVDGPVQKGMIVRLHPDDSTKVRPLTMADQDKMLGVIVDPNDAAVTLSGDGEKVFVATTGRYEVLVSDQNGEIKAEDYLTISSHNGVGMKAGTAEPIVVGRATEDFDAVNKVVGVTKIKDSSGAEREIKFGRIVTDITVSRNPLLKAEEPDLPGYLKKISEAVAGKPVEAKRVYMGLVIFVITTIVATILIISGVRNGLISIGRNPLSKKSIVRGMIQVIITALTIFVLGIFGVYLLLRI